MTDSERFEKVLTQVTGKRVMHKELAGKTESIGV